MKPVIIGSGLAGVAAALSLAPMPVILVTAGKFGGNSSSAWAQGGIAAAMGSDDSPALHAEDTIRAGGGLCDEDAVKEITAAGPAAIEWLVASGVAFDCEEGDLLLGLEGGHKRRRIVHAGDGSGAAIMKALTNRVALASSIEVIEDAAATEILTQHGKVCGVRLMRGEESIVIPTGLLLLATGGAGGLWQETTNPVTSRGQGLALAARAGARLIDLEFMQFHPTAIDVAIAAGRGKNNEPMPLASEALRGEGAILIDNKGERFVDELQPRDVVAKAIWKKRSEGSAVFLDARNIAHFSRRFAAVHKLCADNGIDPSSQPIPVAPAAHYHMGGVATDIRGRTNVKGLWAAGEVGCTGLHGANRLASNSLLEAAVMGRFAAEDMAGTESGSPENAKNLKAGNLMPHETPEQIARIRAVMSRGAGVCRTGEGLQQAVATLMPLAETSPTALAALMIVSAALKREESRGAHMRGDFPETSPAWAKRMDFTLADILPEYPLAAGA